MEYLDTLKKYIGGKEHANKAIRSADGAIAYVTASGVAKHYTSMESLNATAGKNNCPSSYTQLTPKWNDLGFPIGSTMKSGQSCGNENTFVQSEPPETKFDWKFYLENNGDLPQAGLKTGQQATWHWNNHGKFEGRIPNATIMSSMATLGKVGYVDVDTNFHKVPFTPTGNYKVFSSRSNVTGSKMEDCSKPTPTLRYGEPIVFTQNNQTGSLNSTVFSFGKDSSKFFLRPPPGEDRQGQVIRYGDKVCITSSTSSYTSDCGWWGCKVATINMSTNQMEFGPGGNKATMFQLIPPYGSNYVVGTDIKYGYPFSIMTVVTSNVANLKKGVSIGCKGGTQPNGMPGGVYRYSGKNIIQYYPTPDIASSWNQDWGSTTEIDCSTYKLGETATKLNAASLKNGDTVLCASGKSLPNGVQGGVYRYVDDNVLRWYPNAQILRGWLNITKNWWKSVRFNTDCTTYKAGETMTMTMNSTPEEEEVPKFAYVSNGIVVFGSWSESKGSNVFSMQYTEIDKSCNIEKLKQSCTDDCVGFVHSPTNHTWQKIKTTSSPSDYRITGTLQDMYVKETKVDLQDASCDSKNSSFIDSTIFAKYPQSNDLKVGGSGQCKGIKAKEYKSEKISDEAIRMANDYNPSRLMNMQKQQQEKSLSMKSKTKEYVDVIQGIKNTPSMDTLEQQYTDMTVFDSQNKTNLIMWAVISTSILAILIIRNRK